MAFMSVAVGAIGVAVVLFIGYLFIAQARSVMQPALNTVNDTNLTNSVQSTQTVILAGFGLLAIGIIVLAAFGIINIWR